MSFLELVSDSLCHRAESMQLREGIDAPVLYCTECQQCPIDNVFKYILHTQKSTEDYFHSAQLAQAYARWTGNLDVPLRFTLIDVKGILSETVVGQTLRRVEETIRLLEAINAPFVAAPAPPRPTKIMNAFMTRYLDSIMIPHSEALVNGPNTMMKKLLEGLYETVERYISTDYPNPFEYYFDKLVPYVRHCAGELEPLQSGSFRDPNVVKRLIYQFQLSAYIRKTYGQYSIAFDIIHVMVGCYACSVDLKLIGNWALDFMARICRGDFFWKEYKGCRFVRDMRYLVDSNVSFKKRNDLYYVVKSIREGKAGENLSGLLHNYAQLEALVRDKFRYEDVDTTVTETVFMQMFPSVLFERHSDHMAFTMALAHIASNIDSKTGVVKKGTFGKAKGIYRVVVKFMESVHEFDRDGMQWTNEKLQFFLLAYPNLETEMMELASILFTADDSEESDNGGVDEKMDS